MLLEYYFIKDGYLLSQRWTQKGKKNPSQILIIQKFRGKFKSDPTMAPQRQLERKTERTDGDFGLQSGFKPFPANTKFLQDV